MLTQSAPRFIKPAIPVLRRDPPEGPGWIHEIKQDGYRTEIIVEGKTARAYSRTGLDWSDSYRPLLEAAVKTKAKSAIIDGEVVAPDQRGASDFSILRATINRAPERLVFVAFDLLHLDGEDLRSRPIEERRGRLLELVTKANDPRLVFSEGFEEEGAKVFAVAAEMGLEGIVSKRKGSSYRSGETSGWLKTKAMSEGRFEVIGIDKGPEELPMAILAKADDRGLAYAGTAFINLPVDQRDAFWRHVERNQSPTPAIKGLRRKNGIWLRPGMSADVRYLRGEGLLRHASLGAFRVG